VREVTEDPSPFQRLYDPKHPEADAQGWRTLPNVNVPLELVDLITAARAYEANVMAGRMYKEMAQRALTILR
jgi:flagellar basal-body rod protein FlgC